MRNGEKATGWSNVISAKLEVDDCNDFDNGINISNTNKQRTCLIVDARRCRKPTQNVSGHIQDTYLSYLILNHLSDGYTL